MNHRPSVDLCVSEHFDDPSLSKPRPAPPQTASSRLEVLAGSGSSPLLSRHSLFHLSRTRPTSSGHTGSPQPDLSLKSSCHPSLGSGGP